MPYTGTDFSNADVSEQLFLTLDFSRALASGETIASATAELLLLSGVDASPSARLVGSPVISGAGVGQLVNFAGLTLTPADPVNKYRLLVTVQTNLPETLTAWSHIQVSDPTLL